LQQYLEIPRSLHEGAVLVVAKRFAQDFPGMQEEAIHHFAGTALSTYKIYHLSLERELLVVLTAPPFLRGQVFKS
jgi:hypothetical protein